MKTLRAAAICFHIVLAHEIELAVAADTENSQAGRHAGRRILVRRH